MVIKRVNINKAPFSPRDLNLKTPSFVKRNTKVGAPLPEKCKFKKPQVLYFQFQILGQPQLLYFALQNLGLFGALFLLTRLMHYLSNELINFN